ncbi:MAG TPA: YihY/virulence factor BrkB family protein [Caulobacteraceae bacterium]|nr:YihY/virulence factor BrkB family protein [Caulobacteraceae bacterium]
MALAARKAARRGRLLAGVVGRALVRLWGRDVMLYVGGVSFFALLAVFPALALLLGFYGAVFTPEEAQMQAEGLSHLLPIGARDLFARELTGLTDNSIRVISAQSTLAIVIGAYATHRGFKALLAGLNFIHDEEDPHGFVGFNLLAFVVALATFALATVISGVILVARIMGIGEDMEIQGYGWVDSEWLWVSLGLVLGLSCVYRYAMSHRQRVIWPAAITGGIAAAAMALLASWASAFYVNQISALGATFGSIGAVVVFLIWLSWSVNAVFFGGALATEIEMVLAKDRQKSGLKTRSLKTGAPHRAFRR